MVREQFAPQLPATPTRWLEPPWKLLLSNKALLVVLWDLYPDSPYLLPADYQPIAGDHVRKPALSREGANVTITAGGRTIADTAGDYGGPFVYQAYAPLPAFDGMRPVIGSWLVNGHACGIGIREDEGFVTGNTSRFVPHVME
jgi:glutathionylspermidine synthase